MSGSSITPVVLRGISRRFGRNLVLSGIDLELAPGRIVGLMGANGAGKTTLFSIVAGLLAPDQGSRSFAGREARGDETWLRARLAYVAHTTQLYPLLSARENLELFADLRRAGGANDRSATSMLERLGLGAALDRPVATLSRGMAQRVVLARAFAGRPELLLLDEPFTALDGAGRDLLARLLLEERERGAAILLSSHDVDSISSIADRVLLLEGGVVANSVERDDPESFRARVAGLIRASPRPAATPASSVGASAQLA